MKLNILIIAEYYLPGINGGGPIQSIKNLVESLSDKFNFYIITQDRDLGSTKPFEGITTNEWISGSNAKLLYLNNNSISIKNMGKIINSIDYDILYLNSFFSYKFSIIPIILKNLNKLSNKPIIIAPRGEFSKGALTFKKIKKTAFLKIVKSLNLYKNIVWQATSEEEKKDIEIIFGKQSKIQIVENLSAKCSDIKHISRSKQAGGLQIVFISRIHPKKNLLKAFDFLRHIKGDIQFDIYGVLENNEYWQKCQEKIQTLPTNIKVFYCGELNHDEVIPTFQKYHLFLFPTLGENFGHVVAEALIGGCLVITSNQTPWRQLQTKNIGWDIDLKDEIGFSQAIQTCVNFNENDYSELSSSCFYYAQKEFKNDSKLKSYEQLFTQ